MDGAADGPRTCGRAADGPWPPRPARGAATVPAARAERRRPGGRRVRAGWGPPVRRCPALPVGEGYARGAVGVQRVRRPWRGTCRN
ncbi:hypothetical protein SGM_3885 [Streptomyces griseoaurantiacus M045]|uniref:Uncharacterized protein n=1 Tax=Streptomyces griseoaurantiacus M045 TaxID=996637 RepID=F3NL71_9ACTN|nr:hypothetical protein SGM_3885 [Streptomyces griseoaurantiacus M045]